MSGECKMERHMPKEGLPAFFREMADALEKGGGEGEFENLDGFVKFKLSIKEAFGGFNLKMKVKAPRPYVPAAAPIEGQETEGAPGQDNIGGQPRYKNLKKRMKASFKVILRMLHEGQCPPAEAVASFLSDAETMCMYPGKGDPFYPEFLQVCREFADAYDSCDLPRMGAMAEELAHQKARCHALYD